VNKAQLLTNQNQVLEITYNPEQKAFKTFFFFFLKTRRFDCAGNT